MADGTEGTVRDTAPGAPGLPAARRVAATVGVAIALLVVALDGTIVGTAMPRILGELGALGYYSWVTTAYLVTSTVVIPIAGKLGDLFGRKPLVVGGLAGFLVTSWLVGASSTALVLVAMRGVQGVFGGVLTAVTFAVLADIWPLRQRVMLHGAFSAIIGLASAAAPALGGYITDGWGWRWIFYINVPVGLLATALAVAFLPYLPNRGDRRHLDLAGGVLLTATVVPLLVALSISGDHGWTSPLMLGLLAVSAGTLPVLLLAEHRAADPIVPLGLFRRPVFTLAIVIAGLSSVGLYGLAVYVPLLYQGVLGVSATGSGTLLAPLLVGMLVAAPLAGQLLARVRRYRFLGTAGVLCMIAGTWLLSATRPDTGHGTVVAALALTGAGMGLVWPLSTAIVQAALPGGVVGVATSQVNFWRNLGGTVAVVLLGAVLTGGMADRVRERLAAAHLPPDALAGGGSGGSGGGRQDVQALFDPGRLEALRAKLPPARQPQFDAAVAAVREGLADVMHQVFLLAALILVIPLVASLFLKEAPIPKKARKAPAEPGGAAPSSGSS
ncbi:MDR family MFS transporter [Actinomadura parmotrematis]|uniref:MFS transporter n=1 Tax=Actinomadura parmotrematis TaxID=2864039 RepID=A0ABS7FVV1_9ACTN|nr:MDR family MFS transporter [Actinomadura parmotrematis]MBW8484300.1 MFS transporter [Actinomadura parmotrematis]